MGIRCTIPYLNVKIEQQGDELYLRRDDRCWIISSKIEPSHKHYTDLMKHIKNKSYCDVYVLAEDKCYTLKQTIVDIRDSNISVKDTTKNE